MHYDDSDTVSLCTCDCVFTCCQCAVAVAEAAVASSWAGHEIFSSCRLRVHRSHVDSKCTVGLLRRKTRAFYDSQTWCENTLQCSLICT